MISASNTPYDRVLYPSGVYSQTHPGRLAAIATLLGLRPAPVRQCRVLELGCGDGLNITALACAFPSSQFVGIDLAEKPIQTGNELISNLSLRNVELHAMDLLKVSAELGTFDYIIAHGLYSWVPDNVREKIMAICGEMLADQGIAYVSYNAYPGNHLRDLARGLMRYHSTHFDTPEQKIRQSRALLKFVSESKSPPDLYHQILAQELERTLKYSDPGFFHDDLGSINQPFYLHEVAAHASRHGLQYLGEASDSDLRSDGFPEHVIDSLKQMEQEDIVTREQYLDFVRGRAFRQTLLCKRTTEIQRPVSPERLKSLYVASSARPLSTSPQTAHHAPEDFGNHRGMVISVAEPIMKSALIELGHAWPKALSIEELARRCSSPDTNAAEQTGLLQKLLLRGYSLNLVELQTHAPGFVTHVSEKPTVSPLVRTRLQTECTAPNLRHEMLKVEDDIGKALFLLLDGTRDRQALLQALRPAVQSGALPIFENGIQIMDLKQAEAILERDFEKNLEGLAKSATLIA